MELQKPLIKRPNQWNNWKMVEICQSKRTQTTTFPLQLLNLPCPYNQAKTENPLHWRQTMDWPSTPDMNRLRFQTLQPFSPQKSPHQSYNSRQSLFKRSWKPLTRLKNRKKCLKI